MLWRHRSIISYEHLLQVFNCQSLHTIAKYPLLEKFLKQETLLSATKYLPDFVSLKFQLIQKSVEYCSQRRISELSISEFIEFIKNGMFILNILLWTFKFKMLVMKAANFYIFL